MFQSYDLAAQCHEIEGNVNDSFGVLFFMKLRLLAHMGNFIEMGVIPQLWHSYSLDHAI